jgi:hypothetical protein
LGRDREFLETAEKLVDGGRGQYQTGRYDPAHSGGIVAGRFIYPQTCQRYADVTLHVPHAHYLGHVNLSLM